MILLTTKKGNNIYSKLKDKYQELQFISNDALVFIGNDAYTSIKRTEVLKMIGKKELKALIVNYKNNRENINRSKRLPFQYSNEIEHRYSFAL